MVMNILYQEICSKLQLGIHKNNEMHFDKQLDNDNVSLSLRNVYRGSRRSGKFALTVSVTRETESVSR